MCAERTERCTGGGELVFSVIKEKQGKRQMCSHSAPKKFPRSSTLLFVIPIPDIASICSSRLRLYSSRLPCQAQNARICTLRIVPCHSPKPALIWIIQGTSEQVFNHLRSVNFSPSPPSLAWLVEDPVLLGPGTRWIGLYGALMATDERSRLRVDTDG